MTAKATIIILAFIVIIFLTVIPAFALTLTVGNGSGTTSETVQVHILVDDATGIAGAALTLGYDTDNLVLSDIQSHALDTAFAVG